MMKIEFTDEEKLFRTHVRDFLSEHLSDDIREAGRLMTSVYGDHDLSLKWQRILLKQGWAAPSWPVAYGGCDWTVTQHYIFNSELAKAGAPPVSPMGIQMCGPVIIGHGSEQQKKYFLPKMLSGEHFWRQGYSEPNSGSDLASLQMSALVDGDDFICNGSKIWTTHAHEANWVFCLVRTAKDEKPQQGITFLLIDMRSPGIEVKPIISSTGEHIQNTIFFDKVRVPRTNVVGAVDEGWRVAKYLMEFERGGAAYAPLINARLDEIAQFAAGAPGDSTDLLIDDPLFAAKLADARIKASALQTYEFRIMSQVQQGGSLGVTSSVVKILGTQLQQLVAEISLKAVGDYGNAYQPQAAMPGGPSHYYHNTDGFCGSELGALAPLRYINERAGSIYAGSNEIQRNILAKQLLKF
ncbi:MAG: acyl-CoA dehydrogenase family protein [Spongiibacteraceae bacterium]|nr:acyl-CoA dehydrogenase family protein [Spongiibacteraceae bacterium]